MDKYLFEKTVELIVHKGEEVSKETIDKVVDSVSKDPAVSEGHALLDYNVLGPIVEDGKKIYHIEIYFSEKEN